ncbi:hypothetical protein C8F04DRAFT_1199665 [Mycena alexandri]|uniref:Uncharacterized protein n=1 Tax=Mycena alexandri TaxID=1745969 RepID=A0AAD6RZ19_9AGAR|nr:hypothetical protein C8F04DRAFT_1199665 [Mycena alexandri]
MPESFPGSNVFERRTEPERGFRFIVRVMPEPNLAFAFGVQAKADLARRWSRARISSTPAFRTPGRLCALRTPAAANPRPAASIPRALRRHVRVRTYFLNAIHVRTCGICSPGLEDVKPSVLEHISRVLERRGEAVKMKQMGNEKVEWFEVGNQIESIFGCEETKQGLPRPFERGTAAFYGGEGFFESNPREAKSCEKEMITMDLRMTCFVLYFRETTSVAQMLQPN